MNPYDVLEVSPRLTLKEINLRYRELMLIHHPDLHTSEGPDAVAAAERKTRELTEAMAMMRQQHPPEGIRLDNTGFGPTPEGFEPPETDWDKVEATRPMACPLCNKIFEGGVVDVEKHILKAHEIDLYKKQKQKRQKRVLTRGERKMIKNALKYGAFLALIVVAMMLGTFSHIAQGKLNGFDLVVLGTLVLVWFVILTKVVLKRQ